RDGPPFPRSELSMNDLIAQFSREVLSRLETLAGPNKAIDDAIVMLADSLEAGGVIQAFGTGHSEAFAMEIAGRAGGLIATNRIPLRALVLRGGRDVSVLGGADLERDSNVARDLLDLYQIE